MDKNNLDWTSQLVLLRGLFQRFGVLHEAQVLQLRLWPFAVDPSLNKSEAKVDMEARVVTFLWTGSTFNIDKKYQSRLKTLSDNVKFLLGEVWSIEVILEGITIFSTPDTNVSKPSNRSANRKLKRPNRKPKRAKRKPARKGR